MGIPLLFLNKFKNLFASLKFHTKGNTVAQMKFPSAGILLWQLTA
jgi:hypothetical protein